MDSVGALNNKEKQATVLNMKTSHRFINIPRALSKLHNIPSYTKHTTHTVQIQPVLGKTGCLITAQCCVMDRPIQNDTLSDWSIFVG